MVAPARQLLLRLPLLPSDQRDPVPPAAQEEAPTLLGGVAPQDPDPRPLLLLIRNPAGALPWASVALRRLQLRELEALAPDGSQHLLR